MHWPDFIDSVEFNLKRRGLYELDGRGLYRLNSRLLVVGVFEELLEALRRERAQARKGKRVGTPARLLVPGFGVFVVNERPARRVTVPWSPEPIELPRTWSIGFRSGKRARGRR